MNTLNRIDDALARGLICETTCTNLKLWVTSEDFSQFKDELLDLIARDQWADLDDRFYQIIEFGTGGRRGLRGAGTNRINSRTIAESAQGLAEYIRENGDPRRGVAVTFDTRHGSREYARTVCQVLAANDIPSFTYETPRSTPQLSFTIRHMNAQAGCMISASHNPPTDNGIKVSWEDGGQVIFPHDKGIIDKVTRVKGIRQDAFDEAVAAGEITILGEETDNKYMEALDTLVLSDCRDARIMYSPLHGVGATNVVKLFERQGFNLMTVDEQMVADPDFTTVRNQLPNPELPAAMEKVTELAKANGGDLAMASDPDSDRIGATIPCPQWMDPSGWLFVNGNQIGALILNHVVTQLKKRNAMPAEPVVIKTIVTTELLNAICAEHNIEIIDDLLVGFKYIAEETDKLASGKTLIFQTEESHGYNRGLFVRDKDSAPAAMHLAELASELKQQGKTIFDEMNALYRQYGLYVELTRSVYYHGKSGKETMNRIMSDIRNQPPEVIATRTVKTVIDRSTNEIKLPDGTVTGAIEQHTGNVMQFYFDDTGKNRLTARPSGTEPKIKFYAQLWRPVAKAMSDQDIEALRQEVIAEANTLIDFIASTEA